MKPASAEARCLLALARGEPRPLAADAAATDPRRLHTLAQRHGVETLCWWNAERALDPGWRELLSDERDAWRLEFLHHGARNEHLGRELVRLAHALRERDVPALFFKGPWLVWKAWPDPATRPVADIDLGVHERDWTPARDALESLGYCTAHGLPADGARALFRAHHGEQIRFFAPGARPVEVHFRMLNFGPPVRDESWVWDQSEVVRVAGTELRCPGPTAMLLHLALHANQHGFASLRLLHDLRFALDAIHARFDLDELARHARAWRCRAAVFHALALARELAGARVEDELLAQLRPGAVRRMLYERAWRLAAVRRLALEPRPQALEAPRLYLLECGSLMEKLRYVAGVTREAGGPLGLLRAVRATRRER